VSHLLYSLTWLNSSFSGSSQIAMGPFPMGDVNKLFKLQAHGAINFQGATVATSSVFANFLTWGVCLVPHGNSPPDVLTSSDSDAWLIRTGLGNTDFAIGWAPSTDNAGNIGSYAMDGDWAGQQSYGGASQDVFVCLRAFVGSVANANSMGQARLWFI
jgi:hypothetical protein